jgi:hypothetical protein
MTKRNCLVCALATLYLAGCVRNRAAEKSGVNAALKTEHHVVLLSNGQSYIGRIDDLTRPFPVLSEVFYIQFGVPPGGKEVISALIKRGKEWHAPDYMVLNAENIVFIEPVKAGSKVAQLIAEQKRMH